MEQILMKLVPYALQPYAKFVTPAALGVIAAVIALVFGVSDETALRVALVGFVAASIAFITTNAPDGLAKYAKALAPATLTAAGVLVSFLVSGEWNAAEWQLAVTGFGAALVTLVMPNAPDALALDAGVVDDEAAATLEPVTLDDDPADVLSSATYPPPGKGDGIAQAARVESGRVPAPPKEG